jgi:hypothetical protein
MAGAGYSGTPLAKKLGLKAGQTAWLFGMPPSVRAEIEDVGLIEWTTPGPGMDVAHVFLADRSSLEPLLKKLRRQIAADGMVWVSWPKKASKVPTDLTENVIREAALPLGFVDVKVCAVDETWSGLKLVIRKELR